MDEMAEGITVAPEKRKFITDFYPYAFEGIIFSWVRDGMEQDPEELIKMLGACLLYTSNKNRAFFDILV